MTDDERKSAMMTWIAEMSDAEVAPLMREMFVAALLVNDRLRMIAASWSDLPYSDQIAAIESSAGQALLRRAYERHTRSREGATE